MIELFFQIDFPALLTVLLSAVSCSILGSLLLLRKESMMVDSLSHAVLPGLAGAYLFFGSIAPFYMILGAFISCLACVFLIAMTRRYAHIEGGAAMGVVFTSLFALGLFLLEYEGANVAHLDAQHALYGALELTYWPSLRWQDLPADIPALLFVGAIVITVVVMFFKNIQLFLFDPQFAHIVGFKAAWFEWPFFILVTTLIVLSFQAVGSILVIAMFVCPPATARLFCNHLKALMIWAVLIGVFTAFIGYILASWVPEWLGFSYSLSASGMIALFSGIVLFFGILLQSYRGR